MAETWITGAGVLVAAVSAAVGAFTYSRNSRTKAADFLLSLHKTFFIEKTYSDMKCLLDCESSLEQAKLAEVVRMESEEFTDFLNFFELVAYFRSIETLSNDDVEALLGYYLDRIQESSSVLAYVRKSSHGFEHLGRLLVEREAR